MQGRAVRIAAALGVGVVYFAAGKLGLAFAIVHANATAVWPPTGIALAAMLLLGRREKSRVPTVEELLGHVMKTNTGRVCSILFWIWVGWHFFAR